MIKKIQKKMNYFLTACLGPLISRLDAKLAKVESKSPLSILDPVCFSEATDLGPWGWRVSPKASNPPEQKSIFKHQSKKNKKNNENFKFIFVTIESTKKINQNCVHE